MKTWLSRDDTYKILHAHARMGTLIIKCQSNSLCVLIALKWDYASLFLM